MEESEIELILNSYKWIKVPRYEDNEALHIEERLSKLQQHHVEETEFLINKVRELVLILKCSSK